MSSLVKQGDRNVIATQAWLRKSRFPVVGSLTVALIFEGLTIKIVNADSKSTNCGKLIQELSPKTTIINHDERFKNRGVEVSAKDFGPVYISYTNQLGQGGKFKAPVNYESYFKENKSDSRMPSIYFVLAVLSLIIGTLLPSYIIIFVIAAASLFVSYLKANSVFLNNNRQFFESVDLRFRQIPKATKVMASD